MMAPFASPSVYYLGADIAKDSIELFCPQLAVAPSIENSPSGFARLIKILAKSQVPVHVICEATGCYGQGFVSALHQAAINVSVLNPRLPKDFARSLNQKAKTDTIDAKMLAHYGQRMTPSSTAQPEDHQVLLDRLVTRRTQLVEDRTREKARLESTQMAPIVATIKDHIQYLDKLIKSLDEKIFTQVQAHEDLKKKSDLLCKVQGVGFTTAVTLIAQLPELGKIAKNPITALVGLAPYNQDSGQFRGKRAIAGGRIEVRCALYMASLSAIRYNPILKDVYQKLLARGKAKKQALVAVMRKLLIHLNSLIKAHFLEQTQAQQALQPS